jgi:hypothetical protein
MEDLKIVEDWITITQAAELVNRDRSTIQKRISKEQNRLNSRLVIGKDCICKGSTWLINKKRILEIYKDKL